MKSLTTILYALSKEEDQCNGLGLYVKWIGTLCHVEETINVQKHMNIVE